LGRARGAARGRRRPRPGSRGRDHARALRGHRRAVPDRAAPRGGLGSGVSGPPLTGSGWLLAATPVVVLFAAVLSGRLSSSRAAALVLAVTGVVAATAFRAGAAVLGVALGKGLWLGLWILGVVWP